MNGRRERYKACVSKVMGSYPPKKCDQQLCLLFLGGLPWLVKGTTATQQLCLLPWHNFVSLHSQTLSCYDHGNLIVWDIRTSWADINLEMFEYYRLNSLHQHTHIHIHTQTPDLSSYLYLCLADLMCDLTLQLSAVAAVPLFWISHTLLPNRWQ